MNSANMNQGIILIGKTQSLKERKENYTREEEFIKNEERALTMVYWQLKELRWNGVIMSKKVKAILANIRASRIQRIVA